MSTLLGNLSETPIDLRTGLVDVDGNPAPLSAGRSYTIQNTGQSWVYISENAAAPADLAGPWHILEPNETWDADVANEGIWARTFDDRLGRVSATEAG